MKKVPGSSKRGAELVRLVNGQFKAGGRYLQRLG